MIITTIILFSILFIYIILLTIWAIAWCKAQKFVATDNEEPFTVIVPMHNERYHIGYLLKSMLRQSDYLDDVIFVCDHCTDGTLEFIKRFTRDYKQAHVVENPFQQGKKQAIKYGVSLAKYNKIAIVDADCQLPICWSRTIKSFHAEYNPNLLIAPVAMISDGSFLGHLFELDFLALQVCTAGSAFAGHPFMCNGANLSFDKDTYLNHNSHQEYTSGDDMFLLTDVKQKKGNILYIKNSNSIATTSTPHTIHDFLRQRTRWLRKSSGYSNSQLFFIGTIIFLANIVWPTLLVCASYNNCLLIYAVIAFLIKFIFDYGILLSGRNFWNIKTHFIYVFSLSIIYPFSMLIICILSIFRNKKNWE